MSEPLHDSLPGVFTGLSLHQLGSKASARPWLWQGFLAPGDVTLLTSVWKSGKTTLLSVLLARMKQGGTLAGLDVRPGRAVILSEEDPTLWADRAQRLDFGEGHLWFCRPFRTRPTWVEWLGFLDHLVALHERQHLDLFVVDPLSAFLPVSSENEASALMAALTPLRQLTALGLNVLLLHHPRKRASAAGSLARGSGVLSSFADTLIEMTWVDSSDPSDRRRRLAGFGRHRETPRELVIELNAEGTDYTAVTLPDPDAVGCSPVFSPLLLVLEDAPHKLTREAIMHEWPSDYPRPSDATLWRALKQAVDKGRLRCEGTGRKRDPFRYWLPEMETVWEEVYGPSGVPDDDVLRAAFWRSRQWEKELLEKLG